MSGGDGFTRDELSQAAEAKSVRLDVLQAIADRRTVDEKPRMSEALADRLRAADNGRAREPERDTDRDKER